MTFEHDTANAMTRDVSMIGVRDTRAGATRRDCDKPIAVRAMALPVALAALLVASAGASAEGDATRGQKRFEECAACHSLDKAAREAVGPSLYGVFGRKAGTAADFRYSPAMKRSGIEWSAKTIDTFLSDPQAAVPANRMPYAGLPDAAARADLIAYLQNTFK